jgi:hypothetical protein
MPLIASEKLYEAARKLAIKAANGENISPRYCFACHRMVVNLVITARLVNYFQVKKAIKHWEKEKFLTQAAAWYLARKEDPLLAVNNLNDAIAEQSVILTLYGVDRAQPKNKKEYEDSPRHSVMTMVDGKMVGYNNQMSTNSVIQSKYFKMFDWDKIGDHKGNNTLTDKHQKYIVHGVSPIVVAERLMGEGGSSTRFS